MKIYTYYFLKQEKLFSFVEKLSQRSSGQTGVDLKELKNYPLPLPPTKAEQTAIANALSDADALIQSLIRLITKKRQIKQGAMQTLLNPYENGRLKAGWVVKKLGEVVTFRNGKAHEQLIDEHGEFIVVNSKFISTEGKIFKNALLALEQLNKNDVVMVMSDIPNGKALAKCFIVPENNKYTLNQRICALNSESINDIYLALILNRNKYFLSFDSGTGQTNLKKSDVLNCPIYYPKSENEQTRIATILSDMDAEIDALEAKLGKYRHIKQGMMQNLLTGRIRLVKPESKTGAVA